MVKPKKHLGQHFLTDGNIAQKIAESLDLIKYNQILEIGPGTGVLTRYLIPLPADLTVIEIDGESIQYLEAHFLELHGKIIEQSFLTAPLDSIMRKKPFAVIGNFPYNISSQIIFKILEHKNLIPQMVGMFQKEVALRICAKPGNKTYGIISVLCQLHYITEYLFTVPPTVFKPPPKVNSGVIRINRRDDSEFNFSEELLKKTVKMAFNQRRKTLRNSLKSLGLSTELKANTIFDSRPEQLSVSAFINLTNLIEKEVKT